MSLSTGLVSYWKLDETSAPFADSHGSNALTSAGSIGNPTGILNTGVSYVSSASIVQTSANANTLGLHPAGTFSVSGWFRWDTGLAYPVMWAVGSNANTKTQQVFVQSPSSANPDDLIFRTSDGTAFHDIQTAATFASGTWHHVVATYNGSTKAKTLWINNAIAASGTASHGATLDTSTGLFTLLRNTTFASAGSYVDELGFWDGVELTSSQVAQLYNSGAGLSYADLVGSTNTGAFFSCLD